MAKREENVPVEIRIVNIKAVQVVPFGQETAVIKKAGETVEVRKADANYLITMGRAEAVKEQKKSDKK